MRKLVEELKKDLFPALESQGSDQLYQGPTVGEINKQKRRDMVGKVSDAATKVGRGVAGAARGILRTFVGRG